MSKISSFLSQKEISNLQLQFTIPYVQPCGKLCQRSWMKNLMTLFAFKILNGHWSMIDYHENDPHKLIKTTYLQDLISRSVSNNVLQKQKPKVQMWAMHNWFLHSCQNFDEILHDDVRWILMEFSLWRFWQ